MPDSTQQIAQLERIARIMDRAIRLPVVGISVGWDSVLGLIPGIGDALTFGPAAYIVVSAYRMGAPSSLVLRMAGNIAVDAAIGAIPLVGDLFDIAWKANTRNVAMLRSHLEGNGMHPAMACAPDHRAS